MKTPRKMDSNLLNQCKYDDYNTDESQDSQSNGKANSSQIKNSNIS